MNIYLINFLNENQSPYVIDLRGKIYASLENGDLSDFDKYWNQLKNFFYNTINSFDGEVFL